MLKTSPKNTMDSPSPYFHESPRSVQGLRLFRFDRPTGDIYVLWPGLIFIVAVLVIWGFAVHVADRLVFG